MKDALLLVDVVNDFRHEDGEALLTSLRTRQPRLVQALARSRGSIPVVYANDDWGRWDGNTPRMAGDAIAQGLGGELVPRSRRATQSPSC
jgi:nicotinamidase-related amidase